MATTKITNPELFDLGSLNTALKLPSGTTAERPTSPSTGEWRYNTTTNLVEFYDGGSWRDLQSEDIPPTPSENFNTVIYTGDGGAARAVTGVGFQPDLVWVKKRNSGDDNVWFDSSRGVQEEIISNSDAAQATKTGAISSFDADGYTTGANGAINANGDTYVAWCWKANGGTTSSNGDGSSTSTVQVNTKTGFSLVQYVGNQTAGHTIGHGLSAVPEMIIIKCLDTVRPWYVYHVGVDASNPADYNLRLNATDARQNSTTEFNDTAPTSTVFTLGTASGPNGTGDNYIAYCFTSISGFSKMGSYTGNGSTDGPIVNTGFEPAFIMIKNATAIYEWTVYDNKRSTSNPRDEVLYPNTSGAENSGETGDIDFLTNGFQLKASDGSINQNGGTIIYAAFASDASSAPVLADSFSINLFGGINSAQSITGLGFQPDFIWFKNRTGTNSHALFDSVRGNLSSIYSDLTSAANTSSAGQDLTSFDADGFSVGTVSNAGSTNASGGSIVDWNWKANPLTTINTDGTIQSVVSANQAAGLSIVKWTGDGNASATVGHGLASTPDFIMLKDLTDIGSWNGAHVSLASNEGISLNSNAGAFTSMGSNGGITYANLSATNFGFATGSSGVDSVNKNGNDYIAYCFHAVSGFSKFGSYSGNSSTQSITGLGFQPSWVMMKRYDGTENWYIQDSARGSTMQVYANQNAVEFDETNAVTSFDSDGFTMGSYSGINNSGADYIYIAFKENPSTTVVPAGEMSYLVAAGGASGGAFYGGGGGAGGLRTSFGSSSGGGASAESNITLSAGTYTITIGGGGSAITSSTYNQGNNGSASSISGTASVSTVGGGGGGTYVTNTSQLPGLSGGSGGGGGALGQTSPYVSPKGTGTANEGFDGADGGLGSFNGTVGPGGGGGAGTLGVASSGGYRVGGNGGAGLAVNIVPGGIFAAGGAGGGEGGAGTGGTGGGGAGGVASSSSGTNGVINTGSGGGGCGNNGSSLTSGAGGSGVVILRMRTSDYSGSTTGSPVVRVYGDETILTYTGSGTYVHS